LNNDVFVVRMNKIAQFLGDCRYVASVIAKRKSLSKSRIRKIADYRLFFESLQLDPVFAPLASHSLRVLNETTEYIHIYNKTGHTSELNQKAERIESLLDFYDTLLDQIEREARVDGV